MNLFRSKFTRRIIALLAGITFLNMSFIFAEVAALGLSKNTIFFQTILNDGIEEETGCSGESSEKYSSEGIDLSLHHVLIHPRNLISIAEIRNNTLNILSIEPGYKETYSPPPEFLIL